MNIIDPSQLKIVVETICERTKLFFASKTELETKFKTLSDTISNLEARVEALESYHNTPEEPVVDVEDEEPKPEEP